MMQSDPALAEVTALLRAGNLTGAMRVAARLRRAYPTSALAHQVSADIALRRFDWEIAERFYREAISLDDGLWQARNNLANVCRYTDRRTESAQLLRDAIHCCPDRQQAARLHSNLLIHMHSDTGVDQTKIFSELREWRALHLPTLSVSPVRAARSNDGRPLIALVSGAFGSQIFSRLLPHVLREVSQSRFRIELVNTGAAAPVPSFYEGASLSWLNCADVPTLRARDYSIAVDLDGHSPTGSLPLFAMRIAPVQVSWLDCFNSTGVPAMDFFFGDSISTPASLRETFSEQIVLLPQFRLCFDPPEFATRQILTAQPGTSSITYGVFGRFDKHNAALYSHWIEILKRSPNATLLFKATAFDGAELRQHVRRRFHEHGIASDRIRFAGTTDYRAHLELHEQVTLMLDTFPYNGGVSSFDSMLCGVPIVTCLGDHPASRQTAAILQACGLNEYVANSPADYVQCALALAAQPRPSRDDIRHRFLASELIDSHRFAKGLVDAFEQILQ